VRFDARGSSTYRTRAAPGERVSLIGFLDKHRTVAGTGFNRWMVPPAALAIHLSIGQAYAFSVFNLPMTRLVGINHSAPSGWKLTTPGLSAVAKTTIRGAI
jgi:hypothetical protein